MLRNPSSKFAQQFSSSTKVLTSRQKFEVPTTRIQSAATKFVVRLLDYRNSGIFHPELATYARTFAPIFDRFRFRWAYLPYSMKMAGPREALRAFRFGGDLALLEGLSQFRFSGSGRI